MGKDITRVKLIMLREDFMAFGTFLISFLSETNIFLVKYQFNEHKEEEFIKSGFEDVLDELHFILEAYKKRYIPRYIG